MPQIRKYPRTPHLEGSRLQPGDEDLSSVPFSEIAGLHLVVEEKVDGANAGISFDASGELRLQCRGHLLTGGSGHEDQFDLFKAWARTHRQWLWSVLGSRYLVYGEWLYKKHTIFYDALPHYFIEFDVFDMDAGEFLSTARRREMFAGLPIVSAPVIHEGPLWSLENLLDLVGPSLYKTKDWLDRLRELTVERSMGEPDWLSYDGSELVEGLYIKHEADGRVVGRYKWVRPGFSQATSEATVHVAKQRTIPNQLREGVDPFALPD